MRRLVASWFGTGLILGRLRGSDAGSGTVAAAFTMLVWWALTSFDTWVHVAVALTAVALSLWASRPFAQDGSDPGWVVVDEAAGTLVATIGLTGGPVAVAWVAFRAADIFKDRFPGVAAAERLPGSVGVTMDDLVAGIYGLGAGWLMHALVAGAATG